MKRFQDCNWLVKLWRYRHYLYIPFNFINYYIMCVFNPSYKGPYVRAKSLWSVLIGSAQCDMKWYFTTDEVWKSLKIKKDDSR